MEEMEGKENEDEEEREGERCKNLVNTTRPSLEPDSWEVVIG